jgi:23S rRNA (uracil1939-C5)-methyltransferase
VYNRCILTIDSLAYGGSGVGRHKGKVVFVPYTAPGDVVACEITGERKRFSFGESIDVLTPAPDRVTPECVHFGRCGGCQWQYLPYRMQCAAKGEFVRDALGRIAGVDGVTVAETIPSPHPYRYRVRADFSFVGGRRDDCHPLFGYFERKSRKIVDIRGCAVLAEKLDGKVPLIPDALSRLGVRGFGGLEILCGEGDDLSALLTLRGDGRFREKAITDFMKTLDLTGLEVVTKGRVVLSHSTRVRYTSPVMHGEKKYLSARPGGFVQANPFVNRLLIEHLLSLDFSGRRVLELYSGVGNFSIPLALSGAAVLGIEGDEESVADARMNARAFGLSDLKYIVGDVFEKVSKLKKGRAKFDTVVLNPPRIGAKELMGELLALAPDEIVYISCAPPTLARDVHQLIQGGYKIEEAVPFDMFPQTYHVETLVNMKKGGGGSS